MDSNCADSADVYKQDNHNKEYCCFECFIKDSYNAFIGTDIEKILRKYIINNLIKSLKNVSTGFHNKDYEKIIDILFTNKNNNFIKKKLQDTYNTTEFQNVEIQKLLNIVHSNNKLLTDIDKKKNIKVISIFKIIDDKILSLNDNIFLDEIKIAINNISNKICYCDDKIVNYTYKSYLTYLLLMYDKLKKFIMEEKIYFVKDFMNKIYDPDNEYDIDDVKRFYVKEVINSLKDMNEEKEILQLKIKKFNFFFNYWVKLHKYGYYVNDNFETMLHIACKQNFMPLVRILVFSGIDIDYKDINNYYAYQYLSSGSYKIYKKVQNDYLKNHHDMDSINYYQEYVC